MQTFDITTHIAIALNIRVIYFNHYSCLEVSGNTCADAQTAVRQLIAPISFSDTATEYKRAPAY